MPDRKMKSGYTIIKQYTNINAGDDPTERNKFDEATISQYKREDDVQDGTNSE